MRKIIFTAIVLGLTVFVSCQKDKESTENQNGQDYIKMPDYFPKAVGNYWVYETYSINNGQETLLDRIDSIIIVGDTNINGEDYIYCNGNAGEELLGKMPFRDSLGFIIDTNGKVFFTANNLGNIYFDYTCFDNEGDTLYTKKSYTNLFVEEIEVPAGVFQARKKVSKYKNYWFDDSNDSLKYRTIYSFFVDGVGQVTAQSIYSLSTRVTEKRLVRYHIEEQP